MSLDAAESSGSKTRKRSAAKAAGRPSVSKVKASLHLTVEADQRLSIHSTMMGMDRSELVEKLICDHLRRFVVSDRGGAESGNGTIQESLNS